MKDNAKCFIRIKKGIYEEITYKKLKEKRRKYDTYKNKRFIQVDDKLLEVSQREYETFNKEEQRIKYIARADKKLQIISYDNEDENGTVLINTIKDTSCDIENEIERMIEIEQLKKALLQLSNEEYELIKALFYEEETVREYAERKGIPFTTIQSRKNKIIEKLKNILKI